MRREKPFLYTMIQFRISFSRRASVADMFLPIKADFRLPHFPVLTMLVCLVCVGVFLKQQSDWSNFDRAVASYCMKPQSHLEEMVMTRIDELKGATLCGEVMFNISESDDPDREIADIAQSLRPLTGFNSADSREYVTVMLVDELAKFRAIVPHDPDANIAYYTGSWNPVGMLTASFAHADWGHIIFNLIFFVAFATTVEALMGSLGFLFFIAVSSLLIGVTDSVVSALIDDHHWTLGLSGVVMAVMGAHAFLLPRGKIRCYYWFIVVFGSIALPAWLLAVWYIGGDLIQLLGRDDFGGINVLAHVAGGIAGYLYAFFLLKKTRASALTLQRDLDRTEFRPRFR